MSRGGMSHAQDAPLPFREGGDEHAVLQRGGEVDDLGRLDTVGIGHIRGRRILRHPPDQSRLAFPLVEAWLGVQDELLDFQVGFPLGGVHVLAARLAAGRRPVETEEPRLGRRDGVRGVLVGVLPPLPGRLQLLDEAEVLPVTACHHLHAVCLVVVSGEDDFHVAASNLFGVFQLNPAGHRRTDDSLLINAHPFLRVTRLVEVAARHAGRQTDVRLPFHRQGIESDVPVIAFVSFRTGELQVHFPSADDGIGENHLLHRLFRCNPRTARQGKAVADVHAQLQSEAVRLLHAEAHHLPPFGTELLRLPVELGSLRDRLDGHQIRTAQSDALHRFQVGGNTFLGHGTEHPVPEGPRLRFFRRELRELVLERCLCGSLRMQTGEQRQCQTPCC